MKLLNGLLATLLQFGAAFSMAATCDQYPAGMSFVGLTDQGWQLFTTNGEGATPQPITLSTEARTPVMSPNHQHLAFLDEAGQVIERNMNNGEQKIVLQPTQKAGYAQPEYSADGKQLYLVELKQGKSVNTDIIALNRDTQKVTVVAQQRSAQFEPHNQGDWLYYGNVHCVLDCGRIIQEIWRKHLVSGIAEQLTLLNAISRQPSVDQNNQWLYFSSNYQGQYRIYRQSLSTGKLQPVTQDKHMALSPALDNHNRLFFISNNSKGSQLMCQTDNQASPKAMPLPNNLTQLRDLEIRK